MLADADARSPAGSSIDCCTAANAAAGGPVAGVDCTARTDPSYANRAHRDPRADAANPAVAVAALTFPAAGVADFPAVAAAARHAVDPAADESSADAALPGHDDDSAGPAVDAKPAVAAVPGLRVGFAAVAKPAAAALPEPLDAVAVAATLFVAAAAGQRVGFAAAAEPAVVAASAELGAGPHAAAVSVPVELAAEHFSIAPERPDHFSLSGYCPAVFAVPAASLRRVHVPGCVERPRRPSFQPGVLRLVEMKQRSV